MKYIKLVLAAFLVISQGAKATDVNSLNPIKVIEIESALTSDTVKFNATLPAGYSEKTDKRYVLLFDIHPRSQPMHAGMHDWMSHNGAWPWVETIIVTPHSYDSSFRTLYVDYVEGKNKNLIEYFAKSLLPTLNENLRLNGFNIYSGFTGNAAAGLALLLDEPTLFNAYILASPTFKDHPLNFIEKIKKQLPKHKGKPRYVMLSTSDSGYEQAQLNSFSEISQLVSSLAPQNIQVSVKRFDGTYYMTQPVLATSHAIEEIFDDVHQRLAPDSAISKQGPEAIIEYFAYLSNEKYGFEVSAQPSLKALGDSLLNTQPKQAVAVFERAVKQYPESAFAYDALAAAYFHTAQKKKAVSTQEIAVEHSKKLVGYWQNKHQEKLAKYRKALALSH
ncbi:hypothetical protein HII17_09270 [Thalassotalea sp. M1531]|uniref:Esterase n=1 Tax=Thalassotalea algicola TaxID=2716224 RepID=A0A7Y0LCT3_9GAMM|nr:hypothetical protein [Thalassotalea algicola]NMP31752.1 hypothetical protein [Thalassotalea algicola]